MKIINERKVTVVFPMSCKLMYYIVYHNTSFDINFVTEKTLATKFFTDFHLTGTSSSSLRLLLGQVRLYL